MAARTGHGAANRPDLPGVTERRRSFHAPSVGEFPLAEYGGFNRLQREFLPTLRRLAEHLKPGARHRIVAKPGFVVRDLAKIPDVIPVAGPWPTSACRRRRSLSSSSGPLRWTSPRETRVRFGGGPLADHDWCPPVAALRIRTTRRGWVECSIAMRGMDDSGAPGTSDLGRTAAGEAVRRRRRPGQGQLRPGQPRTRHCRCP